RHAVLPRALSARRRRGHPHPPSFPTRRSSDLAATGAIFGAVDVVTVAFAEERGHKAAASVVLSLYALGSCVAGLVFGLLRFAGPAERRWLLGVCAMAVSMIPLLLVGNLPFLAVALFVAGLAIAPTMITTMSLIEEHVPRAQLTEGMTWVSTGLAVGVALGSSAAGRSEEHTSELQ